MENKTLLLIGGISGCGKTSMALYCHDQLNKLGIQTKLPIAYTTRKKRAEEIDGLHYHFVTEQQLNTLIQQNNGIGWDTDRIGDVLYANKVLDTVPNNGQLSILPIHPKILTSMKSKYARGINVRSILVVIDENIQGKWLDTYLTTERSIERVYTNELILQKETLKKVKQWDYVYKPQWQIERDQGHFLDLVKSILNII